MKWLRFRVWVAAAALAVLAVTAAVRTGYAETTAECAERVTLEVGAAMEDANFFERVALGVLWEFLIASCFFE